MIYVFNKIARIEKNPSGGWPKSHIRNKNTAGHIFYASSQPTLIIRSFLAIAPMCKIIIAARTSGMNCKGRQGDAKRHLKLCLIDAISMCCNHSSSVGLQNSTPWHMLCCFNRKPGNPSSIVMTNPITGKSAPKI